MTKRKLFLSVVLLAAFGIPSFASDAYETGYKLFSSNRPAEAIPHLVAAMQDPTVSPSVYIYLGIAYYQMGQYSESLDVFIRGLDTPGADRKVIAFNAGNSAYALRDYSKAEELFTLSSIQDPAFASPVLNRANTRISQDKLQEALEDYERYLVLAPHSSQRKEVEAIIRILKEDQAEKERLAQEEQRIKEEAARLQAEQERLAAAKAEEERRAAEEAARKEAERVAAEKAAEEARIQAEQERLAAEQAEEARREAERLAAEEERREAERVAAQKAAEEARLAAQREAAEERRRRLLEEVAASLQETETTGMNAGSEGVIEYEYESELD